jgi:integrase
MRLERMVGMTDRLKVELAGLLAGSRGQADDLVFGVVSDIKRSWTTVRAKAGLNDVRLHDLRHQAATNFIRSGLSLEETGKLLGHREPKTTYRYVNIDVGTARRAAENLDRMRAPKEED